MNLASVDRMVAWRDKPLAFVNDLWPSFVPEPWQEEFWTYCCNPKRNKRIALQACVGVGKTAGMAIEAWRRMTAYGRPPNLWPRGLAVAIDRDNLKGNFWAEMAKWRVSAPILDEMFQQTAERISRKGRFSDQWYLDARGWSKKADAEEQGRALSGLHSDYPFIIADESATIPQAVLQTATQIESSCEDSLIVQSGNPTSQEGALYHAAVREKKSTHVIAITSDPEAPNRCTRMSKDWAQEQIDRKGRDSAWVQAMVLGQFPEGGIHQLLTYDDVDAAMRVSLTKAEYEFEPVIVSADVAGSGMDATCITVRQGRMVFPQVRLEGNLTGQQMAARMTFIANEHGGADLMSADDTGGWAKSLLESLRTLHYKPIGIQYAGKPTKPGFGNMRAQMAWDAAQAVKHDGVSLPLDNHLREDLVTPLYYHKADKLFIESKDDVKARLPGGRSPDNGDSFNQTYAYKVAAKPDPRNPLFWADPVIKNDSMCVFDDPRKWD